MCIWADLLYFPRGSAPLASFGRRRVEGGGPQSGRQLAVGPAPAHPTHLHCLRRRSHWRV